MSGVDVMAESYASLTPYQYANNDPVYWNDPTGAWSSSFERASNGGCGCWRDKGPQDGGGGGADYSQRTYGSSMGGSAFGTYGAPGINWTNANAFFGASNAERWVKEKWGLDARAGQALVNQEFVRLSIMPNCWTGDSETGSKYLISENLWTGVVTTTRVATGAPPGFWASLGDAALTTGRVILNSAHTTLDIVGLISGAGEVADGINGVLYAARGDGKNAALSFAGMIPFAGWGATGVKFANRAHTVYTGIKNGREYVGITVDLSKRYTAAQRQAMGIQEIYTNVPGRDLARGIEQTLINEKRLGNLANQINSISPSNPKYQGLLDAAKIYMGLH